MNAGPRTDAHLDLYWIPLGSGARVVRLSGRLYEALTARLQRRARCELYHSALVARAHGGETVVEVAPTPDRDGARTRGVVARGAVGSRWLGRLRTFRYEVRRWHGGVIPDLEHAVGSPVRITDDLDVIDHVLHLVGLVPTPVWGRDELGTGDMWNSNSVISWVLTRAGIDDQGATIPPAGRAPGWDAGVITAHRHERIGAAAQT